MRHLVCTIVIDPLIFTASILIINGSGIDTVTQIIPCVIERLIEKFVLSFIIIQIELWTGASLVIMKQP